jgi:uncharacterized membrane protein
MANVTAAPAGGEFRIGPIFGRAWSIYSGDFVKFSIVALVIALPQIFGGEGQTATDHIRNFIVFIIGLIFNTVGQAVILFGAFQEMRGRMFDIAEAVRRGLTRFWPIIGLAILVALGVGIGFILLIVPGVILAIRWSVALPACVVENLGPLASMKRSAELTKGNRWKLFGVFLLVLVIIILASIVVGLFVGLIVGASALAAGEIFAVVVAALVGLVIAAVYTAYLNIVLVMVYHDLRVAKEGVATDQIAAVFD